MKSLGIYPNEETYAHMISLYGKQGNVDKIESLLKEAVYNNLTISKHMYNGLIMAYSKNRDPLNAEKVIREMKEMGLEPDVVCFTNLVVAYNKVWNYEKCWEIYEDCELHNKMDDTFRSIMVRICAATHDAEKGLRLWNLLQA